MVNASWKALAPLALAAIGCIGEETGHPPSTPPTMPMLEPGMATVRGRVVNVDRQGVASAAISVLDMPAGSAPRTTTSTADGSWELTVPGNTTITLRAAANGLAGTLTSAFHVAKGQTSTELELLMLPTAMIDQLNALGGSRPADYGVVALDVVSVSGACDPVGGKITIEPTQLGKIVYARANGSIPQSALTAIQTGARPHAWLVGVLPPGTYYRLTFANAGCTAKTLPVEYRNRSYDGTLNIATKTLSNGLLFVE
jgi:Carboxypeptidase regulatory-like domain